jgi:ATP-dependent Lhr-like helicase
MPSRTGPPTVSGRWSILPLADESATRRAHALGETLLERYGVVTRGSVVSEGVTGGFALVYRTLSGFEEIGRCRRGYFIEGLGAAQFAASGTIDRMRSLAEPASESGAAEGSGSGAGSRDSRRRPVVTTLAATDPANAYGALLPWPKPPEGTTHRPGRKAGALVVLVDGALVLYLERGGKSVLAFVEDEEYLAAAAASVAGIVAGGGMAKLAVETVNGAFIIGTALGGALQAAGFSATPRGLRMRG